MAGSCNPFIEDPFVFPRKPENRPALGTVGYRVAAYGDFVEALMRSIDGAVELRAWTHRAPDDPGIALLEGAAVLGDILTFYQEHYANEAFLRTASWRESVASLTRLLGYRLAPGVGGRATFAFETKGTAPVEIPAGLPLRADLAAVPDPVDFQTEAPLTAYPHLSRMHLYRGRSYGTTLPAGASVVEVDDIGGLSASAALDRLDLKKGDRLLLLPPEPSWTTSGASTLTDVQEPAQIIEVHAVTRRLGRTIVELESPVAESWQAPATAYRLGRSFRHFGHLAPPTYIVGKLEYDTSYLRHVQANHECGNASTSFTLLGEWLPLDQEVHDLAVGGRVVIQTRVQLYAGEARFLTAAKTIRAVRILTMRFASFNGPSTLLTLDAPLLAEKQGATSTWPLCDVRDHLIHEVTSQPIHLVPVASHPTAPFTTGVQALSFFGTVEEARPFAGRRLVLQHVDGRLLELRCTNTPADFVAPAASAGEPRMWQLSLDRPPLPFTPADFDEATPLVTVFGNLADATQGKAQAEVALGNGDAGSRFQTFKLPKAPLTYLLSASATPPQVPELEVLVNGRRWSRVDSLFGRGSDDEVYIVREDPDGASYVQFGDGETGARLPSGIKNVSVRYRTGSGAHGPGKPGADPSLGRRIEGLDKVRLPGIVSGGADPEPADRAREAAPGRVQSLGRLVSMRDYETETLTIPGVTTATAAWALVGGLPALTLSVLLAAGREAEFDAIRATIQHYGRCRGPDRVPIHVQQAFLRYAYLDLVYAYDPRRERADVEAGLRAALGVAGDEAAMRTGLFGLRNRRLGAREYATRVEATCQQVAGVTWCKVTGLAMFGAQETDPATLVMPPAPRKVMAQLVPGANRLLQLDARQLTLSTAPPVSPEECP